MGKEKNEGEMVSCPVGRFFSDLEKVSGKKSKFFEHMTLSRIEFLKAIRSLVDEKIEGLEKRGPAKGPLFSFCFKRAKKTIRGCSSFNTRPKDDKDSQIPGSGQEAFTSVMKLPTNEKPLAQTNQTLRTQRYFVF